MRWGLKKVESYKVTGAERSRAKHFSDKIEKLNQIKSNWLNLFEFLN